MTVPGAGEHNLGYSLPGGRSITESSRTAFARRDAAKTSPSGTTGAHVWSSSSNKNRISVDSRAILALENKGSRTVKIAYADFIFTDPTTKAAFLRYRFRFQKKIGPGETKKFENWIWQKTGKNRKFFEPKEPGSDLVEQTNFAALEVVLTRVEYSDGSYWEHP